eukprot:647293-Prorocentrum_lima.AAC.1
MKRGPQALRCALGVATLQVLRADCFCSGWRARSLLLSWPPRQEAVGQHARHWGRAGLSMISSLLSAAAETASSGPLRG